jgi:hypothetical protein
MFDERFVHRPCLDRFMTHDQYTLEWLFFTLSRGSTERDPFLA